MLGKSVEVGYEKWVVDTFGPEAVVRFDLDDALDHLIEQGWSPNLVAALLKELSLAQSLMVAKALLRLPAEASKAGIEQVLMMLADEGVIVKQHSHAA